MTVETLIEEFSERLARGHGALFVGSGISAASGLPDWNGLLSQSAHDLKLNIANETDLPLVAQFVVNADGGNRGNLIHRITTQISKPHPPNRYHQALSAMAVTSIWTTNYDTLLEQTFPNFFVRTSDSHVSHPVLSPGEIIKIHGCIHRSSPSEIVITREDYEDFFDVRPAMSKRLQMDLVRNSFLFIGYGYGDTNISNIVVEARRLAQKAAGHHYMLQRRERDTDKIARQNLMVDEYRRIGISCALFNDWPDLQSALDKIAVKSRGRTVFITGGHASSSGLATDLGIELAKEKEVIVLDGQSTGVSREAVVAFSNACLLAKQDIRSRLQMFANPYAINPAFQNDLSLLPELQRWREPLMRAAHVVVVFNGSNGTQAELEVAKRNRCLIVPVPENAGDLPSNLLNDPTIADPLLLHVPDYVTNARSYSVTATNLARCVAKLLNS